MAKIDCGEPSDVPCRCDPTVGCGHLSSWHRVVERWRATCLVPNCECVSLFEVCSHVVGSDGEVMSDADAEIRAMGIKL